jgi:hypothetical protein
VWVPRVDDDDNADIDEGTDGEGDADDNADADAANGDIEIDGQGDKEENADGIEANGDTGVADGDVEEGTAAQDGICPGTDHDADWTSFLWKKVRTVEVTVELSKCTLHCDCEHLERTCYVCRHILCLLKAMHGNSFGLANQTLSARLSKSRYWAIFHSGKHIPILDAVPSPTVSREIFDAWFCQQPEPTSVGVPTGGLIGGDDIDHDVGGQEEGGGDDIGGAPHRKKSRQQKLLTITLNRLQDNHYEFMERCKTDKTFADGYLQLQEDYKRQHASRKQRPQPGRQKVDRPRGVADVPKRRRREKTEDRPEVKRACSDFGGDPVLQLRDRILRKGLKSGHYVQIHNSKGEKWFMRIVNGKVLGKNTEDPVLASALWCEPNDVTKLALDAKKKRLGPQTCEIRSIIDAGDMSKFRRK